MDQAGNVWPTFRSTHKFQEKSAGFQPSQHQATKVETKSLSPFQPHLYIDFKQHQDTCDGITLHSIDVKDGGCAILIKPNPVMRPTSSFVVHQ